MQRRRNGPIVRPKSIGDIYEMTATFARQAMNANLDKSASIGIAMQFFIKINPACHRSESVNARAVRSDAPAPNRRTR
jgi:hypothetical protein